jgi:hypothetical protein
VLLRHPEKEDNGTTDGADSDHGDATAGSDLGEAGKKALDEERRARRAAEKQAKDQATQLATLQQQLDELSKKNQTDDERKLAEAVEAAKADAVKALQDQFAGQLAEKDRQIVGARLTAIAAGKLTNPADVLAFVDLDDLDRDGEGNVTDKALSGAVEELLKERPYLAATAGKGGGSVDQGRRKDGPVDFKDRKQLAADLAKFGLTPRG